MNDGHDPIYFVRSYDCPKSRASRDKWLKNRADSGMPVVQHLDRFADIPGEFAKQFAKARK